MGSAGFVGCVEENPNHLSGEVQFPLFLLDDFVHFDGREADEHLGTCAGSSVGKTGVPFSVFPLHSYYFCRKLTDW